MNESLCAACGRNHDTSTCRDAKAIARWQAEVEERKHVSALRKRMDARIQQKQVAPLLARIDALTRELSEARRECDARPVISREDAATLHDWLRSVWGPKGADSWVGRVMAATAALRAHAESADPTPEGGA